MPEVRVIGAGLAGCEAAWQLVSRGIRVRLCEMKPESYTPAHHSPFFGELVCSNSLRSDSVGNAAGLLKEEMRRLGSLIMRAADAHRVPAGSALAVDREGFARMLTDTLKSHPFVEIVSGEVTEIDESVPAVVATGPLTTPALGEKIAALLGQDSLFFYDAAAPIVLYESLDTDKVFRASRYQEGGDYLNCPMTRDQYMAFWQALIGAETASVHGFEERHVFEGCMPIESMARRGEMTLAFGPLKPVGLRDPRTGKRPFAVVQLRQDDAQGRLYNLVGFQTRLKFGEQKRVFSMIPGLENAEFVRYGVMHRNTYLRSPGLLTPNFMLKGHPNLYFAGQMTGVEGYVESAASGMAAGISLACALLGRETPVFDDTTALGALGQYVSGYAGRDFQPMNINFGILRGPDTPIKNKRERYAAIAERALRRTEELRLKIDLAGSGVEGKDV